MPVATTPKAFVGRFSWRPSRWMVCGLLVLTVLAPLAVLQSALSWGLAWPASAAAFGYGTWLARREWSQPMRMLVVPTGVDPVTLDGNPLDDVQVQWRGPLAFLHWRAGQKRVRHLAWWPDTLPGDQRRELKLAMQAREAARPSGSMAP